MEKDSNRDKVEITFDEVILDKPLYEGYIKEYRNDSNEFEVGDYIIYFRGNLTWRAEVIKKVANGYIVKDY